MRDTGVVDDEEELDEEDEDDMDMFVEVDIDWEDGAGDDCFYIIFN